MPHEHRTRKPQPTVLPHDAARHRDPRSWGAQSLCSFCTGADTSRGKATVDFAYSRQVSADEARVYYRPACEACANAIIKRRGQR